MHSALVRLVYYSDFVFLGYFALANLGYTFLMTLSLYSVSLHARYAAGRPFRHLADSPVTPPVSILIAAYNERANILQTVLSLLELDYPEKEIIVVDDGSDDGTLEDLIRQFRLSPMDFIFRERLKTGRPRGIYYNPDYPQLVVVSVAHGGKSRALNVGINLARSPYFCTVDADCLIEREAILRLMAAVVQSHEAVVVSGGIVRIANGCQLRDGRLEKIGLPSSWLELCQIVEYIRTFMFGRPGWNMLNATFIASGAFCVLHKEAVIGAGGFSPDTVTEDIDVIAAVRRFLTEQRQKFRVTFTSDPICWTEAPRSLRMLGRQRRRWQLGMAQTILRNRDMILNRRYGATGMLGIPFHVLIEIVGSVVEAFGTLVLIPLSLLVLGTSWKIFLLFFALAVAYGTLLSMASVVMEEITLRRYPRLKDAMILMLFAVLENIGYRQVVTVYRAWGVLQSVRLRRHGQWEAVKHEGLAVGA
ncbi:MAG: glycosyltransferase family 2 protein [Acidobacteria bacterium]|nr:glycosyltransferase family 2 protein [Acidobacteriota bacterium]